MKRIFVIQVIFCVFVGSAQSNMDTLVIDFIKNCDKNFSLFKKDSTFTNYYISGYKDTVFFNSANCIISAVPSTPPVFKRRILNGWAEGELQVFNSNDTIFSWINGLYEKGVMIRGNLYGYYKKNGILRLTGQFAFGHRFGIWTWYYKNTQIKRVVTYELAEPIKEVYYDVDGNIKGQNDVIKEKSNAKVKSQNVK